MNTLPIENKIDVSCLDKYAAIIGERPSKGARSPELWNKAFRSDGKKFKMIPLDVKSENVVSLLNSLNFDKDFIGGAIAVPYKELVATWLGNNITQEAKKIGAVNCLYRGSDGLLHGTNTDGEAALLTFKDKFGSLENKTVMVLGNGGAGKAVSSYFSSSSANTMLISRCESGKQYANKINAKWDSWGNVDNYIRNVDVIINCTSIGFGDQKSKSPLSAGQIDQVKDSAVVFDIIYQPLKTKLLEMTSRRGIGVLNGLKMNLEQAVLAYRYVVDSSMNQNEIRNVMSQV